MDTKRWEYLSSSEFNIRKVIAAHYLNECDVVVDVGAFNETLPVNTNVELHSIDPLSTIDNAFHGTFSEWLPTFKNNEKKIGVALLGFDFEGDDEEFSSLVSFLSSAHLVVLEYATLFKPSQDQVGKVLMNVHKYFDIGVAFNLDLPEIVCDGFPTYHNRVMYILTRKK